jgi:hypothetical protein
MLATGMKKMSRKLMARICLLLIMVILLILMPTPRSNAAQGWEEYYTVHYCCIVGPSVPSVEGEWWRDCEGNMSGWGWEPGHNCSCTEITYGNYCGTDSPQP